MFKTEIRTTEAERTRLNEIAFCFFIEKLFKVTLDPMRVYDFVDLICSTGNCNSIILRNVLADILSADPRIMPTKKERVWLMYKAGYPVRYITKITKVSQRDYYRIIQEPLEDTNILPRFTPAQSKEIEKFLDTAESLFPERRL